MADHMEAKTELFNQVHMAAHLRHLSRLHRRIEEALL